MDRNYPVCLTDGGNEAKKLVNDLPRDVFGFRSLSVEGILGGDSPDQPRSNAGIPFSNFSDRWTYSLNTSEEVPLTILVFSKFYLYSVEICLTETHPPSSEQKELTALLLLSRSSC